MQPILFISAVVAAALPSVLGAKAYIPYVFNASVPAINGHAVNANNKAFWVNKPVTSTCAPWAPNCPSQNTTIISGPTDDTIGDHNVMWMGILASGGQQLILNIPGQLMYEPVGQLDQARGISRSPFTIVQDSVSNSTILKFTGGDWAVCAEDGAYRVWAQAFGYWKFETGPCYPFLMRLKETNAPAVYQYN